MGIPRFAAWLSKKFPHLVRSAAPASVHGLYIDMNGIIHPCCHGDGDDASTVAQRTDAEKIEQVCLAVNKLVEDARPTSVLFLAMDGVAPRAKMNQQRARRYMTAAEKYGDTRFGLAPQVDGFSADALADAARDLLAAEGGLDQGIYGTALPGPDAVASPTGPARPTTHPAHRGQKKGAVLSNPSSPPSGSPGRPHPTAGGEPKDDFDSNCISPGTVFMEQCADALREHTKQMLATNPLWQSLAVVVSDTNTPGEGEHKVIDFIRAQISHNHSWAGLGHHVIAGKDADLILLCLGLHVPRVTIMRENFRTGTFGPAASTTAAADDKNKKKKAAGGDKDDDAEDNAAGDTLHLRKNLPAGGLAAGDGAAADSASQSGSADDKGDADGKTKPQAAAVSNAKGDAKGPRKGGKGGRFRRPPYDFYDVDTIGAALMTEIYQTSLRASQFLAALPDFTTYQQALHGKGPRGGGGGGKGGPRGNNNKTNTSITAAVAKDAPKNKLDGASKAHAGLPRDQTTGRVLAHPCTSPYNHCVIDDFICLASLMGNDFMPRLPSAFCGDSAMDNILEVYVRCVLPFGYLTDPIRKDIDLPQLHRFLSGYALVETTLFRQQCIKENILQPAAALSTEPAAVGGVATCLAARPPVQLPAPVDEPWRRMYYESTSIGPDLGPREAAAARYVEGIRFVLRYYATSSRTTSWSWFYPYHHAPFAVDIAQFLAPYVTSSNGREMTLPPPKLETDAPLPFPQLMAILPPSSSRLLPPAVAAVMRAPPAGLRDTFPERWTVDYAGSGGQEHLAAVVLPFANFPALVEAAAAAAGTFTADEVRRNQNHATQDVFYTASQPAEELTAELALRLVGHVVRGGLDFSHHVPATPAATEPEAPETESKPQDRRNGSILLFAYECIPSLNVDKPRAYTYQHDPMSATAEEDSGKSAEERKAKRNKRFKERQLKTEIAGYRYSAKNALIASIQRAVGPQAALADFHLAVGAVAAVFVALSSVFVGVGVQAAVCGAALTAFAFATGALLLGLLGIASPNPVKGSGIKRNAIRDTYVDWLCTDCVCTNFAKNERCFACGAPCDEATNAWALFTSRIPATPPNLSPNHAPHIADVTVRYQDAEKGFIPPTTPPPAEAAGEEADGAERCDML